MKHFLTTLFLCLFSMQCVASDQRTIFFRSFDEKQLVQETVEDAHKAYNKYQRKISEVKSEKVDLEILSWIPPVIFFRDPILKNSDLRVKRLKKRQKAKVAKLISFTQSKKFQNNFIKQMIGDQKDWTCQKKKKRKVAEVPVLLKLPKGILNINEKITGRAELNFLLSKKFLLKTAGFSDSAQRLGVFIDKAEKVLDKKTEV